MFKLKNPFRKKAVIVIRPTRFDKRHYVVGDNEVPIIEYIQAKAVRLNALFPYKSVREYYQPIYRAHMKNGPAEAHKVIMQLMLSARLQQFPKWWQKDVYVCYFHTKHSYKSFKKWIQPFKTAINVRYNKIKNWLKTLRKTSKTGK